MYNFPSDITPLHSYLRIMINSKLSVDLLVTRVSQWQITLLLFLFVLLFTFPKYLEIANDPFPIKTYAYFFDKINHPLTSCDKISHETHGAKITFRLTIPLLSNLLGIGSHHSGKNVLWIYILQSSLLLPFLYFLQSIVKRYTTKLNAVLFAAACSGTYLAKSFFWDYDFWFDGFAYFFMLSALFFKNRVLIFLSLQLACWTDERALIALPGIYLFLLLAENNFDISLKISESLSLSKVRPSLVVIFSGLAYLFIRHFLGYIFKLATPLGEASGVSLSLIPFQLKHRLIGIFLTFEGLWLIFAIMMYYIYKSKKGLLLFWLITLALTIQLLVAYSVFDITRSVTYAFPLIITAFILYTKLELKDSQRMVLTATLLCVLVPTQFFIFYPRQIPWTILSLHELKPIIKNLLL